VTAPEAGFDHVGLSVAALEAATGFYGRAFGFTQELTFALGRDDIRGVMLLHPCGARLELFERPGAAAGIQGATPIEALGTRGFGHFAMSTPDLDALFDHATAEGATAVIEPSPSPEPGVRFAFLADLEGNLVELVERADGRGRS
jgi:glyoxylase I family protein